MAGWFRRFDIIVIDGCHRRRCANDDAAVDAATASSTTTWSTVLVNLVGNSVYAVGACAAAGADRLLRSYVLFLVLAAAVRCSWR